MKKLSRRELFKRAAQASVGGAALAVGLKPAKAAPVGIGAGSRFGKSYPGLYPTWTPEVYSIVDVQVEVDETWFKDGLEEAEGLLKEAAKDLK